MRLAQEARVCSSWLIFGSQAQSGVESRFQNLLSLAYNPFMVGNPQRNRSINRGHRKSNG